MPRQRIPLLAGDGTGFERIVARMFERLGYRVRTTPASHDFGADVLATDPATGASICIQAKFYRTAVGLEAVQEVFSARAHYGCREAWVVTNATFTPAARELAGSCGVRLVDGAKLADLLVQAGMDADAQRLAARPAAAGDPEPTLTLADVKARWGCSDAEVKRAIARGLPMAKLPSGRWSVAEKDLAAFERMREREERTYARARLLRRMAPVAAALLVLAGVVVWLLGR